METSIQNPLHKSNTTLGLAKQNGSPSLSRFKTPSTPPPTPPSNSPSNSPQPVHARENGASSPQTSTWTKPSRLKELSDKLPPAPSPIKYLPSLLLCHSSTLSIKETVPVRRSSTALASAEASLKSTKEIDRSDWQSRVLKENPEIAEIKSRIEPLERLIEFGHVYLPKRKEIGETISKFDVLQLILQHLHSEGLKNSRKKLETATKVKLHPSHLELQESRLVTLLRIALKEIERIWEFTMADKLQDDDENEQDLEEHLYDLGMLEEDISATEDMNIWEEPEQDNIIYDPKTKAVKAATLNKLVEKLTSEKDHDMEFQRAFLMTYQSFTSTERLLGKLIQRFLVPHKDENKEHKASVRQIQLRVVNVMKKWLGGHFEDFNDQHIEAVKAFLDKYLKPEGGNLYSQLESALQRQLEGGKFDAKKSRVFNDPPPEPRVDLKTIFLPTLSFLDLDELEIARQLTLQEFELFSKIKPSELLNQAWNKPKLKHRAANVLAMINRTNELSGWITTVILKEERLRIRTRIISKFIKIAEHLRKLNNFNTLMAVLAGINSAPVYRLTFTREEIPRQYQQVLENLIATTSSANSHKIYRETIANIDPPCIPYLGVYLTDLTYADENSNFVKNPSGTKDLINFSKRRLVYNIISGLQQFQQAPYNLQPVHQIATLFKTERLKVLRFDDKELWKLSLVREPRGCDKTSLVL